MGGCASTPHSAAEAGLSSTTAVQREPAPSGGTRFAELLQGKAGCEISDAALRGITLGQLEHLLKCATELCVAEQWKSTAPCANGAGDEALLRPDQFTLYDLVHHLVMPATDGGVRSLTEVLADGPQRPDWFVSHFWGESVSHFIRCLQQHARDRGLGPNTVYWVCAYANRQDPAQVAAELGGTLETSPFYRALFLCQGMVTVLDKDAAAFGRAWCSYETYLALIERDTEFLHDIYTAAADETVYGRVEVGEPVGLTDGFCHADEHDDYIPAIAKAQREAAFPQALADAILGKSVRTAQASMASDLAKIRARIAGVEDEVDATVTARFAVASFDRVLAEDADASEVALRARFLSALKASRLRKLAYSNVEGMPLGKNATAELGAALPSGLEILSLHVGFGDVLIPAFARLLCAPASPLRELTISMCDVSNGGMVALAAALHGNRALAKLDACSNASGDEGAAALGRALAGNTSLTDLDLGSSKIGDVGAAELGKGLRSCTALRTLRLNVNSIADAGAAALVEGLAANTSLTDLDLSRNRITGADAAASLEHGLRANTTLTSLSLRSNKVGDEGAAAFGRALDGNATLKRLNLSANEIGDAGAAALGKGLAANRALDSLELNSNQVGDVGAARLGEGLEANTTLTSLILSWNKIGAAGKASLDGSAVINKEQPRTASVLLVQL